MLPDRPRLGLSLGFLVIPFLVLCPPFSWLGPTLIATIPHGRSSLRSSSISFMSSFSFPLVSPRIAHAPPPALMVPVSPQHTCGAHPICQGPLFMDLKISPPPLQEARNMGDRTSLKLGCPGWRTTETCETYRGHATA